MYAFSSTTVDGVQMKWNTASERFLTVLKKTSPRIVSTVYVFFENESEHFVCNFIVL